MISPTHISVYSLRREELLIESSRERLLAQMHPSTTLPRGTRGHSLTRFMLTALAAIAGWLAALG